MKQLREIIEHFGSDKNLSNYTPTYEELFKYLRKVDLNILEIGIGSLAGGVSNMNKTQIKDYKQGASLRVWKEWFQNGEVWGMDIAEDCMFEEDRIHTLLCDSTDKQKVDELLGDKKFWIIIDDGCHNVDYQIQTFQNLWDRVKDGGIYVIEDIEGNFNSPLYNYFSDREIPINKNQIGNLLWIRKETKQLQSEEVSEAYYKSIENQNYFDY